MSNKRIKTSLVAPNAQNNGAGIQSMPHELLLEILQYLGPPLDRTTGHFGGTPPYPLNNERRRTLHSLSRCCRALRSFFLPLAWEYFDACFARNGHDECHGWGSQSQNLESKSRGLIQNPNLAAYVRVVNVHIVKGSGDEVLSTFAQCLQSLPNVHTLQISGVIGQLATAIKTAFKGHRFLQIRTVIIPAIAHHILSSCPQVKDITCIGRPKEFFISTIAKKYKQVEALNMMVYINYTIEFIAKVMPNLCRITIRLERYHGLNADGIRALAALPRLHTIILREEYDDYGHYLPPADDLEARFQQSIRAATDVLKKHEGDENGKKWVRVWHRTRYFTAEIEDKLWEMDVEVKP